MFRPRQAAFSNGEDLNHLACEVDDLDEALRDLERRGVKVVVRPGEIGGWRAAFVLDPNGIGIELLPRTRGSSPG